MARKLTIKNVLQETVWIAPELLENEEYMNDWSQKYWGVDYNELLKSGENNATENN